MAGSSSKTCATRLWRAHNPAREAWAIPGYSTGGLEWDSLAHAARVRDRLPPFEGPTDNCFIETFKGSLRDECLNVHWFESLEEAKEKTEA
jgi:hypothetical protein